MNEEFTIGITGGIGVGKSVVSRLLRCNGFDVYDCDSEAKHLMVSDPRIKESLISQIGEDVYYSDGSINRGKLAEILFKDHNIRNFVNKIVHQAVRDDIERRRNLIEGLFFIESAIIATAKIDKMCSQVWIIQAPLEERINRVINRDNTDIDSIRKRMDAQEIEFTLLKGDDTLMIENGDNTPLMLIILKLTNSINNLQTFEILC